ncbi:MAG: efflux RND transporter periplasmic adaptor subunit [Synergistaceae bacterium]|jgi:RND family efflux transporter MFP subunit|nr:efflux RND transporter periplasmic adaptor subunit [Synergistaceae bacterium]
MALRSNRRIWITNVVLVVLVAAAIFAKSRITGELGAVQALSAENPAPQEPPAPSVAVYVLERADLAVKREYIGLVEPMQTVAIKPQVAGEIAEVHFKEGSLVKEGDLLFTLDARQYQANVALRKADLAKAQANHARAAKYHERLKAADQRSISASDLDMAQNDVLQGKAAIEQARAALRLAEIDLGYTKIKAPISGRIGRAEFTKGNYVTPASDQLANIVQVDPIRVAFALPDRDYLEQMEAFSSSGKSVYDTTIILANGREHPSGGERDFEDNAMDSRTGSIMTRLRFKNESGALVPGAMVRVRTKPARGHVAVVLPQEAVMANSSGDYVYVVDGANTAQIRPVTLGAEVGAMREVVSGLEAGETVIVRGLQSVRPGAAVNPSPMKADGEERTPAEMAMESGYDVIALKEPSSGSGQ